LGAKQVVEFGVTDKDLPGNGAEQGDPDQEKHEEVRMIDIG
jgi:hypothetical protein